MNEKGFYFDLMPAVVTDEHLKTTAVVVRLVSGFTLTEKFKPIFVMENVLPKFDTEFSFRVIACADWSLTPSIPACVEPATHTIYIREDCYDAACKGNSESLFTVTHEVAHYIYFSVFGVPKNVETQVINGHRVSLSTRMENEADKLMELLSCPEKVCMGRCDVEVLDAYVVKPLVNLLKGLISCIFEELEKIGVARCEGKKPAALPVRKLNTIEKEVAV